MCTFVYVIPLTTLSGPSSSKTKPKLKLQLKRDKVNLDRKYKICTSCILQAKIDPKSKTSLLVLD